MIFKLYFNDNQARKCDKCGASNSNCFRIKEGLAQGTYDKESCYQEALDEMEHDNQAV